MTKDESETIVRIDHGSGTVFVYSTRTSWWAKCRRLGMEEIRHATYRGRIVSRDFSAPEREIGASLRKRVYGLRHAGSFKKQAPQREKTTQTADVAEGQSS